jgi:hypothetical protein
MMISRRPSRTQGSRREFQHHTIFWRERTSNHDDQAAAAAAAAEQQTVAAHFFFSKKKSKKTKKLSLYCVVWSSLVGSSTCETTGASAANAAQLKRTHANSFV